MLEAIRTYKDDSLVFSVMYGKIISHHTLNSVSRREVNIAISDPKMIKNYDIPNFNYYCKKLMTYFNQYEIQSIKFSYGEQEGKIFEVNIVVVLN